MPTKLKVGFSENPRVDPLAQGAIKIEGVELEWERDHPGRLFHRQLTENRYDVFEFSIADYLITKHRPGWEHLGWIALPVFLSKPMGLLRRFMAHDSANIRSFADFRGKAVGVPDYFMTAAVWTRIMLRVLYGIKNTDMTWYNGRPAATRHGRVLDVDRDPTPGLKLTNLEREGELNELLQRGQVQVAYGDEFTAPLREGPQVHLFSTDEVLRQALADLYKKEGVTPINHTLAMKRSFLDQDPGLASRLCAAFEASKQEAYRRAYEQVEAYLLFPGEALAHQQQDFGQDLYPAGLAANRRGLELIGEQLHLDGVLDALPEIDRLWLQP